MRIKRSRVFICLSLFTLFFSLNAGGQTLKESNPLISFPEQKVPGNSNDGYSYRLFIAPNKTFGYDIFQNRRILFHQPALPELTGNKNASLKKQADADKAAINAIDKIKKGLRPDLTTTEVIEITSH